jgi:hypothetical protein
MSKNTTSTKELTLWSIDRHLARIANATDNVDFLTLNLGRIASALEDIASTLSCLTESVEGKDGVARCTVRTHAISPNVLSFQDSSEG